MRYVYPSRRFLSLKRAIDQRRRSRGCRHISQKPTARLNYPKQFPERGIELPLEIFPVNIVLRGFSFPLFWCLIFSDFLFPDPLWDRFSLIFIKKVKVRPTGRAVVCRPCAMAEEQRPPCKLPKLMRRPDGYGRTQSKHSHSIVTALFERPSVQRLLC